MRAFRRPVQSTTIFFPCRWVTLNGKAIRRFFFQCMRIYSSKSLSHKIYTILSQCVSSTFTLYVANPFSNENTSERNINLLFNVCAVSYKHGEALREITCPIPTREVGANRFLVQININRLLIAWSLPIGNLKGGCFIRWVFLRPLPARKVQVNFLPLVCNPLRGLGKVGVVVFKGIG